MIDVIFGRCVFLLIFLADRLGMTYEAINVWIFVVIYPVFALMLIAIVIMQQLRIRKFKSNERSERLQNETTREHHKGVHL